MDNYTAYSIFANRWYSNSSQITYEAQAPLGDLFKLPEYDRYQHSYLFTFGNKLIRGEKGTYTDQDTGTKYNNSRSANSYSDIPNAVFKVNVPIYNAEKEKGFLVTGGGVRPGTVRVRQKSGDQALQD